MTRSERLVEAFESFAKWREQREAEEAMAPAPLSLFDEPATLGQVAPTSELETATVTDVTPAPAPGNVRGSDIFELARGTEKHDGNCPGLASSTTAEPSRVDAAIDSVTEHAGHQWRDHVLDIIERVARRQELVTVDDIAPLIVLPVYDRRALGGVVREAARRGILERVPGAYRTSTRAERHASPVAVWRSRIYREGAS